MLQYLKEELEDVTQNPNFIKWFSGSKVIKADGSPLLVYHGSNAKFNSFSYKYLGTQGRSEGVGFYFTDDKNAAESYGKYLYSCYLSIKKPLRTNAKNFTRATINNIIKQVITLQQSKQGISKQDGYLSNFGDIQYEGMAKIMKDAVDSLVGDKTASDLQGSLVGAGVDPEVVNTAIYNATGYDGIIAKGWGDLEQNNLTIYIPFFANQVKSIDNTQFTTSDNIDEDVRWDNKLQTILNSDEAYTILDQSPADGSTWCAGGCAILAFALNKIYNYPIYVIYNVDKKVVDHFVVKTNDNKFIDCDGSHIDIIKAFRDRELVSGKLEIKPYKTDMNIADIVIDSSATNKLIRLIKGYKL